MIKFFRKIRQQILVEGKTTKYFKYAIGEIVLVMIGILLALQVNNWNIERNNAKQEKALLVQLENEYEENLKEVDEKILMRNGIQLSIKVLFDYMDNGIEGIPLDTIRKHISHTYIVPTFDGPNGVTTEILNSGKLYLIQNPELKVHLTNWKNTTQKVVEEERTEYRNYGTKCGDLKSLGAVRTRQLHVQRQIDQPCDQVRCDPFALVSHGKGLDPSQPFQHRN